MLKPALLFFFFLGQTVPVWTKICLDSSQNMNTFFFVDYVFVFMKRDLQLLTNAFVQSIIDGYGDSMPL